MHFDFDILHFFGFSFDVSLIQEHIFENFTFTIIRKSKISYSFVVTYKSQYLNIAIRRVFLNVLWFNKCVINNVSCFFFFTRKASCHLFFLNQCFLRKSNKNRQIQFLKKLIFLRTTIFPNNPQKLKRNIGTSYTSKICSLLNDVNFSLWRHFSFENFYFLKSIKINIVFKT